VRNRKSISILGILGPTLTGLFAGHSAEAAPALHVEVDQRGDFILVGNTLGQDCAPGIPAPTVGDIGSCANANALGPDVFWRSDSPADGQAEANDTIAPTDARSTAMLTLPLNATVTHAFLYWAASGVSNGGTSATFERPDKLFSQHVVALKTMLPPSGGTVAYQSVADVTETVKNYGSGAYRVGGIDSVDLVNNPSPKNIAFAGWWMVVFYTLASDPPRALALFDGLDLIHNTGNDGVATLSSGFTVPGGATAKLGVVGFGGSVAPAGVNANSLAFGPTLATATSLSDAMNPLGNFFNSTHSYFGSAISAEGDLPQLTGTPGSMSGIDIDVVNVSNLVTAGQKSATIWPTATSSSFLLAGIVTSISTLQPDFAGSVKSAHDINGGALVPGDVIEYSIVVTNSGDDASVNTVLTDTLPAGVTYVPNSLVVVDGANAGTKTDGAGDDQADYDPNSRTVTFRLGAGANAASGGALGIGESTTISFQATVDANAAGTIANQAFITFSGQSGAVPLTLPTTSDPAKPGSPTVVEVVTSDTCTSNADCNADTPFCWTDTHPFACVECLSNGDCTAPGATCNANACIAPPPPHDAGAGSDASIDGGGSTPATDGGTPIVDAGRPGDASSPADASASPNSAADEASGVGAFCNARPTAPTSGIAWLLGASGVTFLAHRRRQRRRPPASG